MCVPWESNPQPFALLTQCSTTEPQELIANLQKSKADSEKKGLQYYITWNWATEFDTIFSHSDPKPAAQIPNPS